MIAPEYLAAVVQGIVEGVTEFLPVSSTGHLILSGHLLGFEDERAKTFDIFIQLGAILAIVWIYRQRFLEVARTVTREPASRRFVTNLALGFVPAAVLGLLLRHWIKAHLFTPVTVAWALLVGGVVILLVERWHRADRVTDARDLPPGLAFGIGVAQTLALVPGVSRSAATILGGYLLGLSRTAATEFSFFLAVPTLAAAAGYDLLKSLSYLSAADVPIFAIGFLVAFVSAFVVVKAFLRYVAHHTFAVFAWYRIGVGLLFLWLAARGTLTLT
ncbi:MAG TPA: undecaprenyl-diphosphate phosphatase [Gemmatimonadales bacterium]|nr:undecaprenyl-diphosphate phosphatase [Gemmatimonadales bacterium]